LKLDLQYKTEGTWINCFETGPVKLPSVAYLGFSAETGELSDNFDIISVETSNLYSSPNDAPQIDLPVRRNRDFTNTAKKSGWGWTFVKFVLFVAVCGGAYFGWTKFKGTAPGQKRTRFD
jgi:lectin, mannose-binding 2